MPKCDFCRRETAVKKCKIIDDMGTRYRNLCNDCITKLGAQSHIDILDETEEETAARAAIIGDVKLTTSPSFEGYRIVDYKGIIFDETLTGIGIRTVAKSLGDMFASLTGEQMHAITDRINELETELIDRMRKKAVAQGANAIISIDFERTNQGGNAVMVSASGTAVVIEKITEEQ